MIFVVFDGIKERNSSKLNTLQSSVYPLSFILHHHVRTKGGSHLSSTPNNAHI